MAATAWGVHHEVLDLLSDKILEFNTDTFNIILGADGSNMADLSLSYYSAVTSEVSTNYGYTQGGEALADPAWTEAAGTAKWDEAGADTVQEGRSTPREVLAVTPPDEDPGHGNCNTAATKLEVLG